MIKILFTIIIFIFFCSSAAFIAWCSGYNFDYRGDDVGFYVFLTIFFSSAFSFIAANIE